MSEIDIETRSFVRTNHRHPLMIKDQSILTIDDRFVFLDRRQFGEKKCCVPTSRCVTFTRRVQTYRDCRDVQRLSPRQHPSNAGRQSAGYRSLSHVIRTLFRTRCDGDAQGRFYEYVVTKKDHVEGRFQKLVGARRVTCHGGACSGWFSHLPPPTFHAPRPKE